ncbi:hypothetical protein QN277_009324 [Acacia crassicarpa]|nr:hypothetical protein QN277_009324 [Acacia crassicarpa]
MFNFNAQRSFFHPTYEDFQPPTETKDTPDSHLLIHLPGFAGENIKAKFESSNRRVKVFGERPLVGSNRWRRFSVFYPVPESCETTKIQLKFEAGIVTILIPKKVIQLRDQQLVRLPTDHDSKASTKKNEEGEASSSEVNARGNEAISQRPKSTIDDGKKVEASVPPEATTGDSIMTRKDQTMSDAKMDKKVQTEKVVGSVAENELMESVRRKETKDRVKEKKVQEGIPATPNTEVEEGKGEKTDMGQEKANENVAGSVSGIGEKQRLEKEKNEDHIEKSSKDEHAIEERREVKAQKGQGQANEVAGSVLENNKDIGVEKNKSEELLGKASDKSEKGNQLETAQEMIPAKFTTTEVKAPKDQELKNENLAWPVSENGKNFRAEKKETKEVIGKASQVENPGHDAFAQKERKECTKKEKEKINGGNSLKEVSSYLKGKGMKNEAASSSQGLKKKEEKFNEEDKQKMIVYVATAALAVSAAISLLNVLRSFANS